jgi:DNA-binding ferritin-like protein (Dps family)
VTTEQNQTRVEILRAHLKQRGLAIVSVSERDYSDLGPFTYTTALAPSQEKEVLADIVDLFEDADFDAEKTIEVPRATVEHLQALSREEHA